MMNFHRKWPSLLRFLPFAVVLCAILFYLLHSKSVSVQDIVNYTPENLYLAAVVLVCLYALKSMTLVFPLSALYLAAGVIFPTPAAILVSSAGLCVSLSLPYCLGYFLGKNAVGKLLTKYEKTKELKKFRMKNEWLFAYILRAIKILPADLVSLFLGAEKMHFWKYILGSFAGLFPTLVSTIAIGSFASEPGSAAFILSSVITALFTFLPLLAYPVIMKRQNKKTEETEDTEEIENTEETEQAVGGEPCICKESP